MSFPAFCRLRDERPQFHDMFERASRMVALTVAPVLLGLAATSEDFTIGVLGPQWSAMSVPLALLATAALVNSLHSLVGAAIEASGRIGFEVFTQGTYAFAIIVGTLVGARCGIEGVSVAVLVACTSAAAASGRKVRLVVVTPPSKPAGGKKHAAGDVVG